jgi:hypothetical protein
MVRIDKDKIKLLKKEQNKKKKTLVNENIAIEEECKNLRTKKEKIGKD